jgi:ribonuclease HIII
MRRGWASGFRFCYCASHMSAKTSFSYKLTPEQQEKLTDILKSGNYRPAEIPHTSIAVKGDGYGVNLYTTGKLLVQGKGGREFVEFILEPLVLEKVTLDYEEELDPEAYTPHMGVDESGKGDFFGPMVIAAAYVDEELVRTMTKMGVCDSKRISSDKKAMSLGRDIRTLLGPKRYATVRIGAASYNRLYLTMRSVNRILAWGHARAIEDLMEKVPDCPRAISDQFGSKEQVERALMKKGRGIKLEQMHRAESDMAVAAASIIAREAFLSSLIKMKEHYGRSEPIPKGASAQVRAAAVSLVRQRGPAVLAECAKCHFRTADAVLEEAGHRRDEMPPEGQVKSQARKTSYKRSKA